MITDAQVEELGSLYLSRLFMLHHARLDALRALLDEPPRFHSETVACGFAAQKGGGRALAAQRTLLS